MIGLSICEECLYDILISQHSDDIHLYNTPNKDEIVLIKNRISLPYSYVELTSLITITYEEYIMRHICFIFSKEEQKFIEINK